MKRPMVLLSAAVLSGILYGLPEVPVIWKIASGSLLIAAVCLAGLKNRGSARPLFFVFVLIIVVLFGGGWIRSAWANRSFSVGEAAEFFQDYKSTNPGQFDYSLYLKSKNISSEQQRTDKLKTQTKLQSYASQILESHVNDTDYGVFQSMLTGDRSILEDSTKDLYQSSGISHLLAVSGLHVALAGAMAQLFAEKFLRLGKRAASFISVIFVFFYAIMTGASASALRAAMMFGFGQAAILFGRTNDSLTGLTVAAALLAFSSPYLLTQSGFQLSFTAILGILAANSLGSSMEDQVQDGKAQKEHKLSQLLEKGLISMKLSLCVSLFTFPPLAAAYYQISFWSFLLNLIVIPLMSVVMISSFCVLLFGALELATGSAFILSSFFRFLSVAVAAPGHYVLQFYDLLCRFFTKLPFSCVTVGNPPAISVILYYLILCFLILLIKRYAVKRKFCFATDGVRLKSAVICCLTLFLFYGASVLVIRPLEKEPVYVTVLDVGQGDCFHIHYYDRDMVIDCGSSGYERAGSRILEPYLLSKAITELDAVIISHADSDHINGIQYLMEEADSIQIRQLFLPPLAEQDEKYDELYEAAEESDISVTLLHEGMVLGSGQMKLTCIYAEEDPLILSDTNRQSDVMLLTCPGLKMLFTGDITEQEEGKLLQIYEGSNVLKGIDVLKCAHHGSDTANSENWISTLKPKTAVLSYGKGNRYGHPAGEVVSRLQNNGIGIWATAEKGAAMILPDQGSGVSFASP